MAGGRVAHHIECDQTGPKKAKWREFRSTRRCCSKASPRCASSSMLGSHSRVRRLAVPRHFLEGWTPGPFGGGGSAAGVAIAATASDKSQEGGYSACWLTAPCSSALTTIR